MAPIFDGMEPDRFHVCLDRFYHLFCLELYTRQSIRPEFVAVKTNSYHYNPQYSFPRYCISTSTPRLQCLRSCSMGLCFYGSRNLIVRIYCHESRHRSSRGILSTAFQIWNRERRELLDWTSSVGLATAGSIFNTDNGRLWFITLHGAVRVALLTNANFETSWRVAEPLTLDSAGLGRFDYDTVSTSLESSLIFWYTYSGVLSNSLYGTAVAPQSCSSDNSSCFSIFYPGGVNTVFPLPPSPQNPSLDVTGFAVYDAPGYQLEFYPPAETPLFAPEVDFRIYPSISPIGLCVKQHGNDLIACTKADKLRQANK